MDAELSPHEAFIADFLKKVAGAQPTELNPNCLSESALFKLLEDPLARKPRPFPSKGDASRFLLDIGILAKIELDTSANEDARNPRLFRIIASHIASQDPMPWELLQASVPKGVICYFTALTIHA